MKCNYLRTAFICPFCGVGKIESKIVREARVTHFWSSLDSYRLELVSPVG